MLSFSGNIVQNQIKSFSFVIEKYNLRIGQFLRTEGDSDISQNKDLMLRMMMIDKTFEIFDKHPLLGIGPSMFTYYDADLLNRRIKYERLWYRSDEYLNSRSSHGVYYQVLAEFGIIGLFIILIIILSPILFFLKKLYKNEYNINDLFSVCLFGIALHFITISALTGSIGWIIIGIAWSNYLNNRSLNKYVN